MEQAHRQEKREREDKKKKAAMLKEAQERAFKANMRYHGIVESRVPAPKTGKVWNCRTAHKTGKVWNCRATGACLV